MLTTLANSERKIIRFCLKSFPWVLWFFATSKKEKNNKCFFLLVMFQGKWSEFGLTLSICENHHEILAMKTYNVKSYERFYIPDKHIGQYVCWDCQTILCRWYQRQEHSNRFDHVDKGTRYPHKSTWKETSLFIFKAPLNKLVHIIFLPSTSRSYHQFPSVLPERHQSQP